MKLTWTTLVLLAVHFRNLLAGIKLQRALIWKVFNCNHLMYVDGKEIKDKQRREHLFACLLLPPFTRFPISNKVKNAKYIFNKILRRTAKHKQRFFAITICHCYHVFFCLGHINKFYTLEAWKRKTEAVFHVSPNRNPRRKNKNTLNGLMAATMWPQSLCSRTAAHRPAVGHRDLKAQLWPTSPRGSLPTDP